MQSAVDRYLAPFAATSRRGQLFRPINSKAHLFMVTVFLQFARPAYGPLAVRTLTLGACASNLAARAAAALRCWFGKAWAGCGGEWALSQGWQAA